jgi:hypothetical protein
VALLLVGRRRDAALALARAAPLVPAAWQPSVASELAAARRP